MAAYMKPREATIAREHVDGSVHEATIAREHVDGSVREATIAREHVDGMYVRAREQPWLLHGNMLKAAYVPLLHGSSVREAHYCMGRC